MHYKKKSFCVAAMHEALWQIILSNWKGTQWDVMILTNGSVYTCMHCHNFFALCACVLCGAPALKTVEFLEVQHRGAFGLLRYEVVWLAVVLHDFLHQLFTCNVRVVFLWVQLHDFCQLLVVAGKFRQISWCVLLLLILLQFLTLQVFLGWSTLNKT